MKALLLAALFVAKPPPIVPEALLEACAKKPLHAPCTVKLGDQTKSGVCVKLPDDTLPACRSANARATAGSTKRYSGT
jgi:hypothetical protein